MKEKTYYGSQTYGTIMEMYTATCGDYGKKIFEGRVLPEAFKYFNGNYQSLIQEISKIINTAGDQKPSEIGDYLSNIRFPPEPKKKRKRLTNTKNSLEKSIKRLEGWLVIHNEGK